MVAPIAEFHLLTFCNDFIQQPPFWILFPTAMGISWPKSSVKPSHNNPPWTTLELCQPLPEIERFSRLKRVKTRRRTTRTVPQLLRTLLLPPFNLPQAYNLQAPWPAILLLPFNLPQARSLPQTPPLPTSDFELRKAQLSANLSIPKMRGRS